MEIFLLMAVGVTVSTALMINKVREPPQRSFAALCLAITFHKGGIFFSPLFPHDTWVWIEGLGLLAIPPLAIRFSLDLFPGQKLLRASDIRAATLFGAAAAGALFTPLAGWETTGRLLYLYADFALLVMYMSLIAHARTMPAGSEKRRLLYLVMACTGAIASYSIPPLFHVIIAGIVYFIWIMLTHPHMSELHDLMARAFVILAYTLFTSVVFYFVVGFFGNGPAPSFTLVFTVSFLILIAIGPFQILLKRMVTGIYPEIRDVFTSPFDLEDRMEREKALLLEKMAPILAHEIRNPLGSIKGAAQFLRSETESEEQRNLLDVITEEVNRLNRVVSQFLDYARPHTPHMKVQSIHDVVDRALALFETDTRAVRIDVVREFHPDLPLVPIDREQILQVILNIFLNAREAMPDGGTLTVRTSRITRGTGDAVGISIRDTGGGIRKEDIRHIFTPFYTTKEQGVGLGLAVCRRILRNHGGSIRVKSIPGQGTIFYIRLETVR